MKRATVNVTTDGSGNALAYSERLNGKIHSVLYVKDGTTPFTDGVDFTITDQDTGENIWTESNVNASKSCYPRAATHSQAGVAALFASGGTAVQDKVGVVGKVKIGIAQGGASKLGKFHILYE